MSPRCAAYVITAMAVAMLALVGCDAMPGRPRPADQPTLPSQVMGLPSSMASPVPGATAQMGVSGPHDR